LDTFYILLTLWIVVMLLWLVNTFYYQNQKRELAYRKARIKEKQQAAAD
jgi:F0F1-type ATP synthase membrane subunit b/b'